MASEKTAPNLSTRSGSVTKRRYTTTMNNAFAAHVPNLPVDTKLSKIRTLRLAIRYISYLMESLAEGDPNSSPVTLTQIYLGKETQSIVSLITVITNICETLNLRHLFFFVSTASRFRTKAENKYQMAPADLGKTTKGV